MAAGGHKRPAGKSADAREENPPRDRDVVQSKKPRKGYSRKELVMVINTNIAASLGAENLNKSTAMLNQSLARLSSGSKIVNASDDPAGLAESMTLGANISEANAANANVSNAVSLLQTQDGYLQQVGAALNQMATLAVQSQDVTKTDGQRADYQAEFKTLAGYITDTASKQFNGVTLFSATSLAVTTDGQGDSFTMASVNMGIAAYTGATGADVSTATLASAALTSVTAAITQLATDRAQVGANEQRLAYTANELGVLSNNLSAAKSQLTDV